MWICESNRWGGGGAAAYFLTTAQPDSYVWSGYQCQIITIRDFQKSDSVVCSSTYQSVKPEDKSSVITPEQLLRSMNSTQDIAQQKPDSVRNRKQYNNHTRVKETTTLFKLILDRKHETGKTEGAQSSLGWLPSPAFPILAGASVCTCDLFFLALISAWPVPTEMIATNIRPKCWFML